jgi:hypothetical protein
VQLPGNEEPCLPLRRAGFSKIDDLCQILNYLLASLVKSPLAKLEKLGRVLVALTPTPPGLAIRRDIPAQRNQAVACECMGYVLNDLIGSEGNAQ